MQGPWIELHLGTPKWTSFSFSFIFLKVMPIEKLDLIFQKTSTFGCMSGILALSMKPSAILSIYFPLLHYTVAIAPLFPADKIIF